MDAIGPTGAFPASHASDAGFWTILDRPTAIAFDCVEELIWEGDVFGRLVVHSLPRMGLQASVWAHPSPVLSIVPCAEGALSVSMGQLRLHDRGGLLRKHVPVACLSGASSDPASGFIEPPRLLSALPVGAPLAEGVISCARTLVGGSGIGGLHLLDMERPYSLAAQTKWVTSTSTHLSKAVSTSSTLPPPVASIPLMHDGGVLAGGPLHSAIVVASASGPRVSVLDSRLRDVRPAWTSSSGHPGGTLALSVQGMYAVSCGWSLPPSAAGAEAIEHTRLPDANLRVFDLRMQRVEETPLIIRGASLTSADPLMANLPLASLASSGALNSPDDASWKDASVSQPWHFFFRTGRLPPATIPAPHAAKQDRRLTGISAVAAASAVGVDSFLEGYCPVATDDGDTPSPVATAASAASQVRSVRPAAVTTDDDAILHPPRPVSLVPASESGGPSFPFGFAASVCLVPSWPSERSPVGVSTVVFGSRGAIARMPLQPPGLGSALRCRSAPVLMESVKFAWNQAYSSGLVVPPPSPVLVTAAVSPSGSLMVIHSAISRGGYLSPSLATSAPSATVGVVSLFVDSQAQELFHHSVMAQGVVNMTGLLPPATAAHFPPPHHAVDVGMESELKKEQLRTLVISSRMNASSLENAAFPAPTSRPDPISQRHTFKGYRFGLASIAMPIVPAAMLRANPGGGNPSPLKVSFNSESLPETAPEKHRSTRTTGGEFLSSFPTHVGDAVIRPRRKYQVNPALATALSEDLQWTRLNTVIRPMSLIFSTARDGPSHAYVDPRSGDRATAERHESLQWASHILTATEETPPWTSSDGGFFSPIEHDGPPSGMPEDLCECLYPPTLEDASMLFSKVAPTSALTAHRTVWVGEDLGDASSGPALPVVPGGLLDWGDDSVCLPLVQLLFRFPTAREALRHHVSPHPQCWATELRLLFDMMELAQASAERVGAHSAPIVTPAAAVRSLKLQSHLRAAGVLNPSPLPHVERSEKMSLLLLEKVFSDLEAVASSAAERTRLDLFARALSIGVEETTVVKALKSAKVASSSKRLVQRTLRAGKHKRIASPVWEGGGFVAALSEALEVTSSARGWNEEVGGDATVSRTYRVRALPPWLWVSAGTGTDPELAAQWRRNDFFPSGVSVDVSGASPLVTPLCERALSSLSSEAGHSATKRSYRIVGMIGHVCEKSEGALSGTSKAAISHSVLVAQVDSTGRLCTSVADDTCKWVVFASQDTRVVDARRVIGLGAVHDGPTPVTVEEASFGLGPWFNPVVVLLAAMDSSSSNATLSPYHPYPPPRTLGTSSHLPIPMSAFSWKYPPIPQPHLGPPPGVTVPLFLPREGDIVALDAEFVAVALEERGAGSDPRAPVITQKTRLAPARVSVLRHDGTVLMDEWICPAEPVIDHLTRFSGVSPGELDPMSSRRRLQSERSVALKLRALVDAGVVWVGHGLPSDFAVLGMCPAPRNVRDTAKLFLGMDGRMRKLKQLASVVLEERIQTESSGHDSVEDANCALALFHKYESFQSHGPDVLAAELRRIDELTAPHAAAMRRVRRTGGQS
jgi:hypothetical protein